MGLEKVSRAAGGEKENMASDTDAVGSDVPPPRRFDGGFDFLLLASRVVCLQIPQGQKKKRNSNVIFFAVDSL